MRVCHAGKVMGFGRVFVSLLATTQGCRCVFVCVETLADDQLSGISPRGNTRLVTRAQTGSESNLKVGSRCRSGCGVGGGGSSEM